MISQSVVTLHCCLNFYSLIETSASFNDRFTLPSLVPFLVIYGIETNRQNFCQSFSLSIENEKKAQYNLSFIGHYTNGNKSTKYHSYIKPNNHYWLKVNVTKNTPFKLLRDILWKYLFHLYQYISVLLLLQSEVSLRKEKRNQRQKS